MAKQISSVLKLKDEFTKTIKTASSATLSFEQKVKLTNNSLKKMKATANDAFKSTIKNAAKAGAAIAGIGAGIGFKEAMDLQGYRVQLETAVKDTQKAARIMSYSIKLANQTPFEGKTMVEAATKFEQMGMSAEKWLVATGNMAAGTNKDIIQATEAIIDAQMGEMERLKEFGIKKEHIVEYANRRMNGIQILNNQNQIVNEQKFQEALLGLMEERYAGGMEKQSKTAKGAWSTITGITKSALANIMGITQDGSTRAGSAIDIATQKMNELGEKLIELQENGTLEKWGENAAKYTEKFFGIAEKGMNFFNENKDAIIYVLKMLLMLKGVNIAVKGGKAVVRDLKSIKEVGKFIVELLKKSKSLTFFKGLKVDISTVWNYLKGVLRAAKIDIYYIWYYLKDISKIKMSSTFKGLKVDISTVWNYLKSIGLPAFLSKVKGGFGKVNSAAGLAKGAILAMLKTGAKFSPYIALVALLAGTVYTLYKNWDRVTAAIRTANEEFLKTPTVTGMPAVKSGYSSGESKPYTKNDFYQSYLSRSGYSSSSLNSRKNSLGSKYFRGGTAVINEYGRGEVVNLPNGSQIIPHDISKKMNRGTNVNVNVNVAGNVIGNREYTNYMAEEVARRIVLAIDGA